MEAIDIIRCTGTRIAWSFDGLMLSVQNEQEISFIDLTKGNLFAHPNFGIRGEMSDHPWSRDGRYFATSGEEGVKIWDLDEKKLLHIFNGKTEARFLIEGNQVAVKESRDWELWDIESFMRVRTIEPQSDWFKFWPDPQFQKLAIVTKAGEFILKDIETDKTETCEFDLDAAKKKNFAALLRSMRLDWAPSGIDFVCEIERVAYASNTDRVTGNKVANLAKLKNLKSFARNFVAIGHGSRALPFDLSQDGQRIVYHQHFHTKSGPFFGFDFATTKHLAATELEIYDDSSQYRISPNGKMVAVVGSELPPKNGVLSKEQTADLGKVRICSLETGKTIRTLDTGFIHELLWSPDSKSLIISVIKTGLVDRDENNTATERWLATAKSTIRKSDKNGDGKLSIKEISFSRSRAMDKDGDGFISADEIVKHLSAAERRAFRNVKFSEIETRIFDCETGTEIQLQPVDPSNEKSKTKFCFQRGSYRSWDYAKPVIHEGKIVLPLFDISTIRNGQRTTGMREALDHKDKLGFFDLTTGKLTDVIELDFKFEGNRLLLTNDMILIGVSSKHRNSMIDSFVAFDRRNGNKGFIPAEHSAISIEIPMSQRIETLQKAGQLPGGVPHLSPSHPYVAVNSKGNLKIWKLDSDNSTFRRIKTIRCSAKYNRGLASSLYWHPTEPSIAWIDDNGVHQHHVEEDLTNQFNDSSIIRGVMATDDGWLIAGSNRIIQFDRNLNIQKTWLPTERFESFDVAGKIDQCVEANGKLINPDAAKNLRAILLRENRIETMDIKEFEQLEH